MKVNKIALFSWLIFTLKMEPLVTKMKESVDMSGIPFGSMVHKITLYAYDVILMLTNPVSSLIAVQSILK